MQKPKHLYVTGVITGMVSGLLSSVTFYRSYLYVVQGLDTGKLNEKSAVLMVVSVLVGAVLGGGVATIAHQVNVKRKTVYIPLIVLGGLFVIFLFWMSGIFDSVA